MSALTLRLQDSLDQQIRTLAAQQQISLSDFARNALESYAKQVQQELQLQDMIKAAEAMHQNPMIGPEVASLTQEFDFDNAELSGLDPANADDQQGWWR